MILNPFIFSIADLRHAPEYYPKSNISTNENNNCNFTSHKKLVRSLRSIANSLIGSPTPTASRSKAKVKTASVIQKHNTKSSQRKRMAMGHRSFRLPPYIDTSRSTKNVSVMVGSQLLLTCIIPNTGNESVSESFLTLVLDIVL